MTSSNGKLSTLPGLYEGNPPVTSGIPSQNQLWCFLWSEQAIIWTKVGILLIGVEPMLEYCQLYPGDQISMKFSSKYNNLHSGKCVWKWRVENGVCLSRRRYIWMAAWQSLKRHCITRYYENQWWVVLCRLKSGWLNQRPCVKCSLNVKLCVSQIFSHHKFILCIMI